MNRELVKNRLKNRLASISGKEKPSLHRLPKHVGIIPDGNRRYSKIVKIPYNVAYKAGYNNLRNIMKELLNIGIRYLSVYALSYDNCTKRKEDELKTLFDLILQGVEELSEDKDLIEKKIRVMFFGEIDVLPDYVKKAVLNLEETTSHRTGGILGVALCYSSILEIENDIEGSGRPISYRVLPPIDLIIRTGGQKRLSDFFVVNSRYSELYFIDKPWPMFTRSDLFEALLWYQRVQRNFGR